MKFFNNKNKQNYIFAPQNGKALSISETPDDVFSEKVLGDGVGILPKDGEVFSPVSGTIEHIAHTFHAVCLKSDDGLEILLHLGIDTVKLNGEGFTCYVEQGQHVNAGDKLMKMDLDFIKSKGLSTISPCIITNLDKIKKLNMFTGQVIAGKTEIMSYTI